MILERKEESSKDILLTQEKSYPFSFSNTYSLPDERLLKEFWRHKGVLQDLVVLCSPPPYRVRQDLYTE